MTLIVNMVGGPGTGKSTAAAGTFAELKHQGVNCELVTEYAKDLVWSRSHHTLGNQIYIFGKQYHRLWRLLDQVDVVVTDAPIILSLFYGQDHGSKFLELVRDTYEEMDNLTIFLERIKAYNPAGRNQTEDEARQIDRDLLNLLEKYQVDYETVAANRAAPDQIARLVIERLES